MKLVRHIIACAALCAPVAAFAQNTLPVPPVTSSTATPGKTPTDPNRLICKSEADTGSRISTHKTCLTAAQWKETMFKSGQWTEHQQTYNSAVSGGR